MFRLRVGIYLTSGLRRWGYRLAWSLALLLFTASLCSRPDTAGAQEAKNIALYIIVDSSGSMAGSDPLNLRWAAVRLLTSLLDEGDELAVLAFSTDVIPFRGPDDQYGPLIRIDRDIDKPTLLADLEHIVSNIQPDGYTDMLAAFQAVEPLVRQARTESRPYIIFLTDGTPELADGLPSDYKEMMLQLIARLNVPLYAGGLLPEGTCQTPNPEQAENQKFLQQLVNAAPQGHAQCITESAQLPAFFLESFGRIADRHYMPLSNGRFEIREDQVGLIQQLTLIYLAREIGCQTPGQTSLCIPIYTPTGHQLTQADIDTRLDLHASFDNDFIVLSINDPTAGSWLLEPSSGQTYAIVQTRLRMEIAAPASGISRQALGQPLPIQVRFFQEAEDGSEQPLPEGYTSTFHKQELQLIDPPDQAKITSLHLIYNPEKDRYEDRISPLDQAGTYLVSLEAEVGGFQIVKQQRVQLEPFPSLKLVGMPEDSLIQVEPQQSIEFNLVPDLNRQVEPITGLTAELIKVVCNGQPMTVHLQESLDDRYNFSLKPPQEKVSRCELLIEGIVKHVGTPYHLSFGPTDFEVQLLPMPTPTPAATPTPTKPNLPSATPSLIHDVNGGIYELTSPFSLLSDEEVRIDFTLTAHQLPEEAILQVTIIDEIGKQVPGVISLLNNTLIPTDGSQSYQLRLQQTKESDPWPPDWFNRRPITFTVKLDTLLEVPILPKETFDVTAIRRSRLEIWTLWFRENQQDIIRSGLLSVASAVSLWLASILGWRINRSRRRTEPLEDVTVIRLGPDGQILGSKSETLIQFSELRHRLFGVRIGSHNQFIPQPPFRVFPPEAYWRWKLKANQIDIEHGGDDTVVFELYTERGSDGVTLDPDAELDPSSLEEQYRLANQAKEPLDISRGHQFVPFTVESGAVQPLSPGDVILTGHNSRVQFGGIPPKNTPLPPTPP